MDQVTCPNCSSHRIFLMEKAENKYWLEFDEDDGLAIGSLEEEVGSDDNHILCEDCGEKFGWYEIEDWMGGA